MTRTTRDETKAGAAIHILAMQDGVSLGDERRSMQEAIDRLWEAASEKTRLRELFPDAPPTPEQLIAAMSRECHF